MPKTMKKTSRSSKQSKAKKPGRKRIAASSASSTARRYSRNTKGRAAMSRRSSAGARSHRARAARGQRPDGGSVSQHTTHSKWIESTDEHEDRKGQSLATRNHDVIRQWAEERQAVPSTVQSTGRNGQAGMLKLDFSGYGGNNLGELTWDEWFETFDERNLVFVYQEHTTDGSMSNFFRLTNPDDSRVPTRSALP